MRVKALEFFCFTFSVTDSGNDLDLSKVLIDIRQAVIPCHNFSILTCMRNQASRCVSVFIKQVKSKLIQEVTHDSHSYQVY